MDVTIMQNSTSSLPEVLQIEEKLVIPYLVILSIISVTGSLGNLLIIVTIFRMARGPSRGVGSVFIINLAISDLLVTAVINPFSIVGVIRGHTFFEEKSNLCAFLASLSVVCCVTSLLSIGVIAVNRFVYICHHGNYSKLFTLPKSITICVLLWGTSTLVDLPSHVGWSQQTFDHKSHQCFWDRDHSYSYTSFFAGVGVIIPFVIIVKFYLKIFIYMQNAKSKLDQFTIYGSQKVFFKTLKQARMMFMVFVVFSLSWSPYIFVLLIDRSDTFPVSAHLYSSLVAKIHASVNFIIYGASNSTFLEGYRSLFCIGRGCFKRRPTEDDLHADHRRDTPSDTGCIGDTHDTLISAVNEENRHCTWFSLVCGILKRRLSQETIHDTLSNGVSGDGHLPLHSHSTNQTNIASQKLHCSMPDDCIQEQDKADPSSCSCTKEIPETVYEPNDMCQGHLLKTQNQINKTISTENVDSSNVDPLLLDNDNQHEKVCHCDIDDTGKYETGSSNL